jgi:hypothetical protein
MMTVQLLAGDGPVSRHVGTFHFRGVKVRTADGSLRVPVANSEIVPLTCAFKLYPPASLSRARVEELAQRIADELSTGRGIGRIGGYGWNVE